MKANRRILLAGLFHETHTFLDQPSTVNDFSVRKGKELLDCRGDGSPIDGVLEAAEAFAWTVVPAMDLRATPGGIVPDAIVETFWEGLISTLRGSAPPDAILLVLHGAMVSQSHRDVEGELLARIRGIPGLERLPVVAVLDLHANVTPRMARHADGLILYQKNPHTDARATAVRAAHLLEHRLASGARTRVLYAHPPMVLAPSVTGTDDDPMRSLLAVARRAERDHPGLLEVGVAGGFSFADLPETGLSFLAVAEDAAVETGRRILDELCRLSWTFRDRCLPAFLSVEEAVETLLPLSDGPNILVEPSDNIGAGAPGDGTGLLRLLLHFPDRPSAVVINDPDAVRRLASVSIGREVDVALGGRGSRFDEGPVQIAGTKVSSSDGAFSLEDRQSHLASMNGVHIEMGPCVVLRHHRLQILVTSKRTPPFDLGQLRSQGIVPEQQWAIAVKAAVAHRRAYDPIAVRSFIIDTPGPCAGDPRSFDFEHLRRPVFPLDPIDNPEPHVLRYP
ncbi:MAG: M81 family metallopeptidase [Opitutaceae bacterium]